MGVDTHRLRTTVVGKRILKFEPRSEMLSDNLVSYLLSLMRTLKNASRKPDITLAWGQLLGELTSIKRLSWKHGRGFRGVTGPVCSG